MVFADEFEADLEMSKQWAEIVQAAGMYDPSQNPQNLLLLGGAIMNDQVVNIRRMAKLRAWVLANGYAVDPPVPFTVQVLKEMSPAERVALKNRIVARHVKGA